MATQSDIKDKIKAGMQAAANETDPAAQDAAIDALAAEIAAAITDAINGTDVSFTLTDSQGGAVTGTISLTGPA